MKLTKGGRLEGLSDWFAPNPDWIKRKMADTQIWNELREKNCDSWPAVECLARVFADAKRWPYTRHIPFDMAY
jgi:hypothetical protein